MHVIFLLKKNIKTNIILGYLSIAVLESLKEWKVAITSVGKEYKSTKNMIKWDTLQRIAS